MEMGRTYEIPAEAAVSTGENVNTKKCYTIDEVSLILNLSRPSVMKLLRQQEFKWFKLGTTYRISKDSFEEWLRMTL